MAINYLCASQLARLNQVSRVKAKRLTFAAGIVFNLVLLGYFRYTDFFIESVNSISKSDLALLRLTLPLAISFFTFQQIAYLAETHKGNLGRQSMLTYASFVTLFPQLIAGPIVYHSELIPQLTERRTRFPDYDNFSRGIVVFAIGLAMKVVIADSLASFVDYGFGDPQSLSTLEAWIATISFSLQIYFDFAGYTTMAVGLGLLINISLPINFDRPYLSTDVQEFWRRWHITLGRFLRDYLYIPLGGNRSGLAVTSRNILVVFLLGGLWHGASWTFVVWGFLIGLGVSVQGVARHFEVKIHRLLAWIVTLMFMNFVWVFFRAESLASAGHMLGAMIGVGNDGAGGIGYSGEKLASITSSIGQNSITGPIIWVVVAFILSLTVDPTWRAISGWRLTLKTLLVTVIMLVASIPILFWGPSREFIYFNF